MVTDIERTTCTDAFANTRPCALTWWIPAAAGSDDGERRRRIELLNGCCFDAGTPISPSTEMKSGWAISLSCDVNAFESDAVERRGTRDFFLRSRTFVSTAMISIQSTAYQSINVDSRGGQSIRLLSWTKMVIRRAIRFRVCQSGNH